MTQGPETARAIADILTLVLVDQQTGLAFGVGSSTAPKDQLPPSRRHDRTAHSIVLPKVRLVGKLFE